LHSIGYNWGNGYSDHAALTGVIALEKIG